MSNELIGLSCGIAESTRTRRSASATSTEQFVKRSMLKTFAKDSPAAQGYRLPAEWVSHQATWLSWPRRDGISFPDAYDDVMPIFAQMVDALGASEPVRINVVDHDHEQQVRYFLKDIDASHVEFFHIPTNEPWCRDHGPI